MSLSTQERKCPFTTITCQFHFNMEHKTSKASVPREFKILLIMSPPTRAPQRYKFSMRAFGTSNFIKKPDLVSAKSLCGAYIRKLRFIRMRSVLERLNTLQTCTNLRIITSRCELETIYICFDACRRYQCWMLHRTLYITFDNNRNFSSDKRFGTRTQALKTGLTRTKPWKLALRLFNFLLNYIHLLLRYFLKHDFIVCTMQYFLQIIINGHEFCRSWLLILRKSATNLSRIQTPDIRKEPWDMKKSCIRPTVRYAVKPFEEIEP